MEQTRDNIIKDGVCYFVYYGDIVKYNFRSWYHTNFGWEVAARTNEHYLDIGADRLPQEQLLCTSDYAFMKQHEKHLHKNLLMLHAG